MDVLVVSADLQEFLSVSRRLPATYSLELSPSWKHAYQRLIHGNFTACWWGKLSYFPIEIETAQERFPGVSFCSLDADLVTKLYDSPHLDVTLPSALHWST
jgi:hypothetical protein